MYFQGKTQHLRLFPKKHYLQYPLFWFNVELVAETVVETTTIPLKGFCCFKPQHHGNIESPATSLNDLRDWVLKKWENISLSIEDKNRIKSCQLHTFPSVGGYAFKPVSFYVAYDEFSQPIAFLAEVNNTFGERYCYPFLLEKTKIKDYFVLETDKKLQVSPFNQIEGFYRFRLYLNQKNPKFFVLYFTESLKLITSLQGKSTQKSLFKLNLTHPLQSMMIMGKIHYQAIKLLFKRIPFFGVNGEK